MTRPKTLDMFMRDTDNTRFMGVPCQQYHTDFWLWELFFEKYKINTFIELGTGRGGTTMFFMMHSIQRSFKFYTFDSSVPYAVADPLWTYLDISSHFCMGDIFNEGKRYVEEAILRSERPIMLYCDNGDKPREMREFTPLLSKDDFVSVHDWSHEVRLMDIPESLEMIILYECEVIGSRTRWMRKKI